MFHLIILFKFQEKLQPSASSFVEEGGKKKTSSFRQRENQ